MLWRGNRDNEESKYKKHQNFLFKFISIEFYLHRVWASVNWSFHRNQFIDLLCKSLDIFDRLLRWLAHLVSRFAYNTGVIVDASSNPPVSNVKSLKQKPSINSLSKETNIASSINQSNGNSIRWEISSSSSLVNTSVAIKNTW